MVMKGQGRSDGANSSGLKPSSAKFLGSKNSEQAGSNPVPTIDGGSLGTLDLYKLSDANIQVTKIGIRRWQTKAWSCMMIDGFGNVVNCEIDQVIVEIGYRLT